MAAETITADLMTAAGGIGLFLVGMRMMTDGLRALAGENLRRMLRRSTRSPARGAVAGALATAMVQSSSATTVAAVGFVGAGLMSFEQSLGIMFGANIGSTLTGWLVAIVGFKLQIGALLAPGALIGALMRMFAPGRWKDVGWSLAGFSVLFIGVGLLQAGMEPFQGALTPERFPADSFGGRLQLVAIGLAATVVTQSSGAGVAAALAALAAGAISFPQAAALVIGMDVGTTVSAALATLGGSTAARRTGFAHVIYNLLTGSMAFALLWPLDWLTRGRAFDPEIALVGFHTAFNLLGVLLVLGVSDRFARLVTRLVPERRSDLAAPLDGRLLAEPAAAMDAAVATTRAIARALAEILEAQVARGGAARLQERLEAARRAGAETRDYVERVGERAEAGPAATADRIDVLHALDHLDRLRHRCGQTARAAAAAAAPELAGAAAEVAALGRAIAAQPDAETEARADALRERLHGLREADRDAAIAMAVGGEIDGATLSARLDAGRWLQRVAYHLWRIAAHLRAAETEARAPAPEAGVA